MRLADELRAEQERAKREEQLRKASDANVKVISFDINPSPGVVAERRGSVGVSHPAALGSTHGIPGINRYHCSVSGQWQKLIEPIK